MSTDEQYMLRCLELAQLGIGPSAPNPSVGCVVVYNGEIIGEGYTSAYGGPHAEVNAINSVRNNELLPDSTVYVSLEPCAHFGKTPPCADLLVSSKVKRVVIGCKDPFSKVNGAGIERLKNAGIDVSVGVLEEQCKELNRRFFTFHEKKRPYIILKWAETEDGFADGIRSEENQKPLKITGNASSTLVHKWRTEEASILVGKNTVLSDDPALSSRHYNGKNPIRIALGSIGSENKNLQIFDGSAETILVSPDNLEFTRSETILIKDAKDFQSVMDALYRRNILSILVEGGPTIHQWFYENAWDEIRRFVTPMKISSGIPAMRLEVEPIETQKIGNDHLYVYRNR
jgi:diaminohydroxyphosphoribosylaminopyrimidine deaminase/5-amino-6-(5-phosphoribosylamino)uracil reductase